MGPALPRCVPICDVLEQFTGLHTATSEQHKYQRPSTQTRDNNLCALADGTPSIAGCEPDRLVSLSTEMVVDAYVNCDDAVEIGCAATSQMDCRTFTDIKLHRNDKVTTIGEKCKTIKTR